MKPLDALEGVELFKSDLVTDYLGVFIKLLSLSLSMSSILNSGSNWLCQFSSKKLVGFEMNFEIILQVALKL